MARSAALALALFGLAALAAAQPPHLRGSPGPAMGRITPVVQSSAVQTVGADGDVDPVPGYRNSVGYAFDTVSERYTLPVVQFSYDDGKTFKQPDTDITYKVPDQLEVRPDSGTHDQDVSDEFHSISEYMHTHSSWVSVGVDWGYKYLNLSAQFTHTKNTMESHFAESTRTMAYGERNLKYYDLALWPFLPLHPNFERGLATLADTYGEKDGDKATYLRVLRAFGTHYCARASFGAMVNWTTTYDNEITKDHSASYVTNELNLSINIAKWKLGIDGHMGDKDNKTKVDEDFAKHSRSEVESVGGSATVKEIGEYKDWVLSTLKAPVALPHKIGLVPIFDLITDETKRGNMEKALVDYGNGVLH